jgi:hypothetical protein
MQIGSDRHEAVLRLVVGSSPCALFLRAFASHWCRVIELLYQPEAHGFSTNFASRKRIAFTNQHFVRRTMGVMNNLIDAAPGAECTRRMIFSASGAFHKNSRLTAGKRGRVRAMAAVRSWMAGERLRLSYERGLAWRRQIWI